MTSEDDSDSEGGEPRYRRHVLQGVGATGVAGVLAGCLGSDDSSAGENGADDSNGEDSSADENGADDPSGDENGADDSNGEDPEPAYFAVSGLLPTDIEATRGESIDVEATVENTGDEEGTQEIELRVGDEVVDSTELSLGADEDDDVTLTLETADLDAGEHAHAVASEDEEASGTLDLAALLEDPDRIFRFDDESLSLTTGTNAVTGTLSNLYNETVEDGDVTLDVPGGWELVDAAGTSFELDSGDSQDVEWEIEVPDDADGEYEVTADVSYSALDESADVSVTADAVVVKPGGGASDEFEGSELDEEIWTRIVREEDAEHSVGDGTLTVPTYEAGLDGSPLILQPIEEGYWQVTTKVEIDPTEEYHQAGLVCYGDDGNHVELGHFYGGDGKSVEITRDVDGSEQDYVRVHEPDASGTVYLRMIHEGGEITGAYSLDGEEYTELGTMDRSHVEDPYLGLYTYMGATGNPRIEADFDWVRFE